MGTSVPYSGANVVASCARVSTPCSLHALARMRPSSGLPEKANGMLLMKCGSSLLVYTPSQCGAQLRW